MGEDEFEKFFDSITPAGSYDAHDPTHRALRYTQEIAWRAGREAGMREAVGIIQAEKVDADTTGEDADEAYNLAITHCTGAILAAIGEKHD